MALVGHLGGNAHHGVPNTSLEQFIPDIMTRILEFVELRDRLRFARCNTTVLKLVTKECTDLWKTIDIPRDRAWRMTDSMLAALLTRVNARDVTTSLSLYATSHRFYTSSGRLSGRGIEPLRNSRVLQRVTLRENRYGEYDFDEPFVVDVLRTSLMYRLEEVKFPARGWNKVDMAVRESFNRDLNAAKYRRAIEQGITCDSCRTPVCDTSRQIVPTVHGIPPSQCNTCRMHYCRTIPCPVAISDCQQCGRTSCGACNDLQRCTKCGLSSCNDCKFVTPPCLYCKGSFCEECATAAFECDDCKTWICEPCSTTEGNEPLFHCERRCGRDYCQECRTAHICDGCEQSMCSQCCEGPYQCALCPNIVCACDNCTVHKCDRCDKTVCQSCQEGARNLEVDFCRGCHQQFCSDCGFFCCQSCGESCCSDCVDKYGYVARYTVRCSDCDHEGCRCDGSGTYDAFCCGMFKDKHITEDTTDPSVYYGIASPRKKRKIDNA